MIHLEIDREESPGEMRVRLECERCGLESSDAGRCDSDDFAAVEITAKVVRAMARHRAGWSLLDGRDYCGICRIEDPEMQP